MRQARCANRAPTLEVVMQEFIDRFTPAGQGSVSTPFVDIYANCFGPIETALRLLRPYKVLKKLIRLFYDDMI